MVLEDPETCTRPLPGATRSSARNLGKKHARKSESAQWPVARLRCRERDPKKPFPAVWDSWARTVLTPTLLALALPGQRAASSSLSLDTVTHSRSQSSTVRRTRSSLGTRALTAHECISREPTRDVCVRARGSPISPLRHTHLVRMPTRPGLPRQPRGRARGQRAPPHGYLCDPPPFHGRSRGAPTAPSPAWARPGSRASQAGSAKAPAVRSQTPGTKARREWRAPRGRPPSDTN